MQVGGVEHVEIAEVEKLIFVLRVRELYADFLSGRCWDSGKRDRLPTQEFYRRP